MHIVPTFTGEKDYKLGLRTLRSLGRQFRFPEAEPVTGLAHRGERGHVVANREMAAALTGVSHYAASLCFGHAVALAVAVIRDAYLVTHFRLIRPLVQFGVRDEDSFTALALPFLQGIG